MLQLFNTISRQKEKFQSINEGRVGIYSCGPTVYGPPHIGNLRAFIFADMLRRTLELLDYKVTQVINITDVGHLTTDANSGEDKLETGARREGKTVWEVAQFYEQQFLVALKKLNIKKPSKLPRATDHIIEQVALIQQLMKKGFTYEISDGIYFDTSKFESYGKLSGQNLADKEAGARVAVKTEKRHPADFALWKFCVGENADHVMRWDFDRGQQAVNNKQQIVNSKQFESEIRAKKIGFPGWHLECSAMSMKYLDETFDIHTGGIDHIPVHHENEIAQSEAATGQKFVNYWLHNEFLTVDGGKMSKSIGNLYTLEDLAVKGFDPLVFRYLCLGTHYRQKLNFTWEALKSAAISLNKLREYFQALPASQVGRTAMEEKFTAVLADDLNTSQALAVVWEVIHDDELSLVAKRKTLEKFDAVLGLQLDQKPEKVKLSAAQNKLLKERESARKNKDFARSDEIRAEFAKSGLDIEDTAGGQAVRKQPR